MLNHMFIFWSNIRCFFYTSTCLFQQDSAKLHFACTTKAQLHIKIWNSYLSLSDKYFDIIQSQQRMPQIQ